MTNEEAIEILRKIPVGILDLSNEDKWDLTEAIDIAINALEQNQKEFLSMGFDVIDTKTGKYPDWEKIVLNEEWAKGLIYCDIDGIAIQEDGNLILMDDCGNYRYCPSNRFKIIQSHNSKSSSDSENWEPCVMCESCTNCWFCMNSKTGKPCADCDEYSKFNPVSYCRYCGRPLTQEAWAELEKRIRGGMKFKVGAKIVVKDVHCGGNFENGDIVTVAEIGSEDDPNCYGAISPHDGLVWYLYDDEVSLATNADHIRSMTDEELAKEFVVAGEFENRVCFCCEYFKCLQNKDGHCIYKHGRCNMDARLEAYKKWLQQPAEE